MADHRTAADIAQEAREGRMEERMEKAKNAWVAAGRRKWNKGEDGEAGGESEVDDDYHDYLKAERNYNAALPDIGPERADVYYYRALRDAAPEGSKARADYEAELAKAEARLPNSPGRKRGREDSEEAEKVVDVNWRAMGQVVTRDELPKNKVALEIFLEQDLLARFPVPAGPHGRAIPEPLNRSFIVVNGGLLEDDNAVCSVATAACASDRPQHEDTKNMLQWHSDVTIRRVLEAVLGGDGIGEHRFKRFRNSASIAFQGGKEEEDARELHGMRPDFCLNYGGQTVFVGEEKVAGNMAGAIRDVQKKLYWKRADLGDELPYLLAYAQAGSIIQFLVVEADGEVTDILKPLDVTEGLERLAIVRAVVNVARILPQLAACVPECQRSVLSQQRAHGVSIGRSGEHFLKTVNLTNAEAKKHMDAQTLTRLYQEVLAPGHGLPHTVEVFRVSVPSPADPKLRLELGPMAADPFEHEAPRELAVVKRALSHVLLSLQALHERGWCHRDVRWPNVLQRRDGDGDYMLIDFEFAAPHGTKVTWPNDEHQPPEARPSHGLNQVAWAPKHDLWQVGKLLLPFQADYPQIAEIRGAVTYLCSLEGDGTAAGASSLPFFSG